MSREHGILMKPEMVRALLRPVGDPLRKTETRRTSARWAKVQPGDLLLVREKHARKCGEQHRACVIYGATDEDLWAHSMNGAPWWTPGIHMPRWASRLTLRVVSVTEEEGTWWRDAHAADRHHPPHPLQYSHRHGIGIVPLPAVDDAAARREGVADRAAYLALWREINGDEYPDRLWCIAFERVAATGAP